jgi:hypothetical protein
MRNLRQKFDPTDLEILDRVYETACAYIEARDLYCDHEHIAKEQAALRKTVFVQEQGLDFDLLCDAVFANMVDPRAAAAEVWFRQKCRYEIVHSWN